MTRRYPEDRITLAEIRKHPWLHGAQEVSIFEKVMTQKISAVSEFTKDRIAKEIQHSHLDHNPNHILKPPILSETLKKAMLDFKQRIQKARKEAKSSFTSSKSSSEGELNGPEIEESQKSLDQPPPCMDPIHKRVESWGSQSDNDENSSS